MNPRRIDFGLLDTELKSLINASSKIFPITQDELYNHTNINSYEFGKIYNLDENATYIYKWDSVALNWTKVGTDNHFVDFIRDVQNKPTSYPNSQAHSHNNHDIINTITLELIQAWNNKADVSIIPTNNNQLINGAHYLVASDVSGKADKSYVDGQLGTKASVSTLNGHVSNSNIHLLPDDREAINATVVITLGSNQPLKGWWYKEV